VSFHLGAKQGGGAPCARKERSYPRVSSNSGGNSQSHPFSE
jgi:hypothetical protein